MNKNLSLSQRIHNCAASQEAEFVHAIHTYLHARANATEEWSQIWSQNEDVSWAHAFGRMRGFKSVWNGSVTCYDVQATQRFQGAYEAMPEIGGFDIRPLMELSLHTLATDIVEVADDGKTARAFFLTPGLISSAIGSNGKRRVSGLWERYGADFIFEDGTWLFLHEHVCPDMGIGCDSGNPGMQNYLQQKGGGMGGPGGPGGPGGGPGGPGGGPGGSGGPGGPGGPGGGPGGPAPGGLRTRPDCEDPGPLHSNWSVVQTVQNTVPWPVPYATMDDNNTYTPSKK